MGGRCFVAVRQMRDDDLYLFAGTDAAALKDRGIRAATLLGRWGGGPSRWGWEDVRKILKR
jgi:hypothetical protein